MKLFKRKGHKAENGKVYRLSAKGAAFIAAVESGLLPEICVNGERGYDGELFERFWCMYTRSLIEKRILPIPAQDADSA